MHSKNQAFFNGSVLKAVRWASALPGMHTSELRSTRPGHPEGHAVRDSPLAVLTAPTLPHPRALGTKVYDIWILLMHTPLTKLDRCTTHDATIPFPGVRTIMTQTPGPSSVDRALLIIYSSSGFCHIFSAVPLTYTIAAHCPIFHLSLLPPPPS